MLEDFQPYHPEFSSAFKCNPITELKYNYALQNIIFFAVHVNNEFTLSYYKDGQKVMDTNSPAVLHFLDDEFVDLDFHDKFWAVREWVAQQNRINSLSGLSFTHQTYRDLMSDLSDAEEEAQQIILGNDISHEY